MMKSGLIVVSAAASALLVSSSAFAFCFGEKAFDAGPFGLGTDTVQCRDGSLAASARVSKIDFTSYTYLVGAENLTSEVGGVLLDETGSVVIGDQGNGVRGPCSQSAFGTDIRIAQFNCLDADAPVRIIRVFAE